MKKYLLAITLSFIALTGMFPEDNIKNSVVKIYSTKISFSYTQPWQIGTEKMFTGSGVIIEGKKIITNAHVVENNSFLQVLKSNSTIKYNAKVVFYGHDSDLALLEVEDDNFFEGTKPVPFDDIPNIQDSVMVYGFPMGGEKLSITSGKVNRIEILPYSHSGNELLTIQIDAPINPGNSGGPVIKDGKIAGIAFQYYSGDNLGYMIPASVVKHFLNDIKDGVADGIPSLGIDYQKLESKDFKKYLGLSADSNGVYIIKTFYGYSCADKIFPGDVLLSIDNINIANDATFQFRVDDRLDFSYLITNKLIGDNITAKVFRNKKIVELNIKLKKESPLIKPKQYEKKPQYFVFGGLVFVPLNMDYMSTKSSYLRKYMNAEKTPAVEEIVLLQRVLAVDVTEGYQQFENLAIEEINGSKISSLKDLIAKIENIKDDYLIIKLDDSQKIVIDYKKARNVNGEIFKKYMIPADRCVY